MRAAELRSANMTPIRNLLYRRISPYNCAAVRKLTGVFTGFVTLNDAGHSYVNLMGDILRVKMRWGGMPGAPGLSVFHFTHPSGSFADLDAGAAQEAVDRVDTFAAGVVFWMPYQTTLEVLSDVELIDGASGDLEDIFGTTPDATRTSPQSAGQVYAGPVGAIINWKTATIRNGRRLRGKTFLVPLNGGVFSDNGTPAAGLITSLNTHATNLRTAGTDTQLAIYGRPMTPAIGIVPEGVVGLVSAHNVPDFAAVLRSRRD